MIVIKPHWLRDHGEMSRAMGTLVERVAYLETVVREALAELSEPADVRAACAILELPSTDVLIVRSSLGTPEAKALRESVPESVVDRVLRRADELDREEALDREGSLPAGKEVRKPNPNHLLYCEGCGTTRFVMSGPVGFFCVRCAPNAYAWQRSEALVKDEAPNLNNAAGNEGELGELSNPARALHLVTQRNQPYGSVRRCCEQCGVMVGDIAWTDDEATFDASPVNCRQTKKTSEPLTADDAAVAASIKRVTRDHVTLIKALGVEQRTGQPTPALAVDDYVRGWCREPNGDLAIGRVHRVGDGPTALIDWWSGPNRRTCTWFPISALVRIEPDPRATNVTMMRRVDQRCFYRSNQERYWAQTPSDQVAESRGALDLQHVSDCACEVLDVAHLHTIAGCKGCETLWNQSRELAVQQSESPLIAPPTVREAWNMAIDDVLKAVTQLRSPEPTETGGTPRTNEASSGPRWAPPSTADGKPIEVGDLLLEHERYSGVFAGRVMRVIEVDSHCGNSSDICVRPEYDEGVNEHRIRVHGSFFRKTSPRTGQPYSPNEPAFITKDRDRWRAKALAAENELAKFQADPPRPPGVPPLAHRPEYMKLSRRFCEVNFSDREEALEDHVFELEAMMAKAYADGYDDRSDSLAGSAKPRGPKIGDRVRHVKSKQEGKVLWMNMVVQVDGVRDRIQWTAENIEVIP